MSKLQLRLTPAEHRLLREEATSRGLTVSALVREACRG